MRVANTPTEFTLVRSVVARGGDYSYLMKFVFWLKLATIRLPNVSYILCAKRLWSVCCGGVFAIGVHARVNCVSFRMRSFS